MSNGKVWILTDAVYHGTYQHAGKKKATRKRKYGDVQHLPLAEKSDRLPLSDISNSVPTTPGTSTPMAILSTASAGNLPSVSPIQESMPQPLPQVRLCPKPPTMKSKEHFFVTVLNNRIKKCSGCGNCFHDNTSGQPEYVLGHLESH